jgi:hypothetical protein
LWCDGGQGSPHTAFRCLLWTIAARLTSWGLYRTPPRIWRGSPCRPFESFSDSIVSKREVSQTEKLSKGTHGDPRHTRGGVGHSPQLVRHAAMVYASLSTLCAVNPGPPSHVHTRERLIGLFRCTSFHIAMAWTRLLLLVLQLATFDINIDISCDRRTWFRHCARLAPTQGTTRTGALVPQHSRHVRH